MTNNQQRTDQEGSVIQNAILPELKQLSPYLELLHQQLGGALKDTEHSVVALIEQINKIRHQAYSQNQESLSAKDIADQITEVLGHLQFQDVLRQRVEQVQSALTELDGHFSDIAKDLSNPDWDGHIQPHLKQRMDNLIGQYVMHSQRAVHSAATGGLLADDDNRPTIELF